MVKYTMDCQVPLRKRSADTHAVFIVKFFGDRGVANHSAGDSRPDQRRMPGELGPEPTAARNGRRDRYGDGQVAPLFRRIPMRRSSDFERGPGLSAIAIYFPVRSP